MRRGREEVFTYAAFFVCRRVECTLGARDFSSAVSGFSANARKTSGTQGTLSEDRHKNGCEGDQRGRSNA